MRIRNLQLLSLGLMAPLFLGSCSMNINKDKTADGKKHVDIETPMGSLHVSDQADVKETGMSVYPGATPKAKDDSSDEKSANVNISGPGFALRVVAAEFESDAAPDKVLSYYKSELKKYGNVLECHGNWHGGGNADIHSGKDESKPVSCESNDNGKSVELKVGTEGNQHIVAVEPKEGKTNFALVYVKIHGKDAQI